MTQWPLYNIDEVEAPDGAHCYTIDSVSDMKVYKGEWYTVLEFLPGYPPPSDDRERLTLRLWLSPSAKYRLKNVMYEL